MSSNKHQCTYDSSKAVLVKVEDLVREIVIQNDIPYHRIQASMQRYAQVGGEDIYLPVVRIVTYFEDSVSAITRVLCSEFDVAIEESAENKKIRIDNFSSKHVQYIVGLKPNRSELIEYKRTGTEKFEIQICSLLQNAWSGIEKELGFDRETVPEAAKRDFYRVGALLEMVDLELLKIRSLIGKKTNNNAPATPPAAQVSLPPVAPPVERKVETPAVAAVTPAPEPKPEPQPIAAERQPFSLLAKVFPTATATVNGLAPQRIMYPKPAAGLAPQRIRLEAMDMSIQDSKSLAVNVNNIDNRNGQPESSISDMLNMGREADMSSYLPQGATDDIFPSRSPETAKTADNVALNIDTVENFNLNVAGGMLDKAAEKAAQPAAPVPFYEEAPKPATPAPIDENSQMTDATLREYVLNSKLLREVDMQIAARAGAKLNEEIDIEGDVERLRFLKVFSLRQLHERIADNKSDIVAFAEKWIGKDNGGSFDKGISLFYLEYLLVGKKNDPGFAVEYVLKFISDNDYSARYIIPTYNSIRNAEVSNYSHLTLK